MILRFIIMLAFVGLVMGGIFGWKQHQAEQRAMQPGPPPAVIASTEVLEENWQPSLAATGSLVALQGVEVTTELPGQVEEILFQSGTQVEQGDILLKLDDSVDRANLDAALAEQRLAEVRFNRARELLKKQAVSQADFDEASANLDNARARVASQREQVRKKTIRAPFTGGLGIRRVNLGEYLSAGAAIVPLQTLDPIYVDYSLPEQELSRVAVGQTLSITIKAYPGKVFNGTISAINPGIDPETRSIRLRGTLANPDRLLRPGMFAQVQTWLPMRKSVMTLPDIAITYTPYGDSVFVIDNENGNLTARRQQVVTGETRDGRVEIVDGLQPGQKVVTDGHVKLRNGQQIRVDNSFKPEPEVTGNE